MIPNSRPNWLPIVSSVASPWRRLLVITSINANLVRRWIQEHERYGDLDVSTTPSPIQRDVAAQFIAMPASMNKPIESASQDPSPPIQIKLERGDLIVSIQWPLSHAQQCAAWLNEATR